VHYPPGLEVRNHLLDYPAGLVHLAVELLLPVQKLFFGKNSRRCNGVFVTSGDE
jgi:hypothetical protein